MNLKYPKVMAWTQKSYKREGSKALIQSRSHPKHRSLPIKNHKLFDPTSPLFPPFHLWHWPSAVQKARAEFRRSESQCGSGIQNGPRMRVRTIYGDTKKLVSYRHTFKCLYLALACHLFNTAPFGGRVCANP